MGKRTVNAFDPNHETETILWYHTPCFFESQKRILTLSKASPATLLEALRKDCEKMNLDVALLASDVSECGAIHEDISAQNSEDQEEKDPSEGTCEFAHGTRKYWLLTSLSGIKGFGSLKQQDKQEIASQFAAFIKEAIDKKERSVKKERKRKVAYEWVSEGQPLQQSDEIELAFNSNKGFLKVFVLIFNHCYLV